MFSGFTSSLRPNSTNIIQQLATNVKTCGLVSNLDRTSSSPTDISVEISQIAKQWFLTWMLLDMAYCIRAPGYIPPTPTTPAPPTTSQPGPPGPTHTGQPANCNKWHVVVSGDSCGSVAAAYGISPAQFFQWNPAVSTDCTTNFWLGQAYCVGVGGGGATPTTTTTAPGLPSPTQDGNAVEGCNKFAQAVDDDTCSTFAGRNDVSLQQLYTWNRVLGSDGKGCATSLWATYWYCVGVRVESKARPTVQLR